MADEISKWEAVGCGAAFCALTCFIPTLQALEKIMYRQTTRSREQIARMIAERDGPVTPAQEQR